MRDETYKRYDGFDRDRNDSMYDPGDRRNRRSLIIGHWLQFHLFLGRAIPRAYMGM